MTNKINDPVSLNGSQEFNEETEFTPITVNTRASRGPTDILPSRSRAFQEQNENSSSQEIARQVEDDMQFHMAQIICKQRDVHISLIVWLIH